MESDYERQLGVIEALTAVRDQCPSGAVRRMAEQALANAGSSEAGKLREQAWLVLTAMQGWRGDRASQVHRSLKAFVDGANADASQPDEA